MGLRFTKHIKLGKHLRLNISKSGVGISGGVRGARISFNPKTGVRSSVGLPGTGIYYSEQHKLACQKVLKTPIVIRKKFIMSHFLFYSIITSPWFCFGGIIYILNHIHNKK